ncbi:ATP-binding protein [Streptomyces sp. NPDC002306]
MEPVGRGDEVSPHHAHALATALPLDGADSSIAQARRLAADFLARARADGEVTVSARAMDVTQLVVSELVTNARKYAPGPVLMELRIAGGAVEVTVQDSARVRPVACSGDARRLGRHGLEIVMAVAERFDVHLDPEGKRVTAHIALAENPARH